MSRLGNYISADMREKKIVNRQNAGDIVKLLLICDYNSRPYKEILKKYFDEGDELKTCQKIWAWMKKNIQYRKEPPSRQTGKTIGRILNDKYGDCKAFATFCVACCKACDIPVNFRLASYKWNDKTPTHIYAVAKINGRQVVIDGVLNRFDYEAPYKYAYDVKPLN